MAVVIGARRRVLSLAKLQLNHSTFTAAASSSSNDSLLIKLLKTPNPNIKSTLQFESQSESASLSQFDSLVTALSSFSPDKARLVLEWRLDWMLDKNERDHLQYSKLISLCATIRNVPLSMHVFNSMEASGIKPTTTVFNSLIHACFSSMASVLTAFSLFEIEQNSELYKPDSQTYDTFVSGFSNLRDVDKMLAWFAAKQPAGFSGNLHNYECVISACVKTGDFDKADRFYNEMMSVRVVPSVSVLEWILEGICKCKKCDRVEEFLNFLLECRYEITGNMIEKIVQLYSELEKGDEMEKLLDTFTEFNQTGEALLRLHCGIIRYHAKMDRLDDVEFSIGRMMNGGMLFQSSNDIEKVISSYFRMEAYDRLDLVLEHIKGYQKLERSTYGLLVAGYRRARLADKLQMVMQEMKSVGLL